MCRVRLYFVVQEQLYSKAHSDQLLYCNPPLQDPFGGNNIDEVVLNVIHCAQCHSLCSMSFITLPHNFKKCSLMERPRRNPRMKSPRLL